jgi:hypothetical protein
LGSVWAPLGQCLRLCFGGPELSGLGTWDPTHTEKQALVFLDGSQAAQEARHHDNGAYGDDEVGCRQRGKAGGECGKVALGHRQPYAHSKQSTATELERKESPLDQHCPHTHLCRSHKTTRPTPTETRERGKPGYWPDIPQTQSLGDLDTCPHLSMSHHLPHLAKELDSFRIIESL